MNTFNGFFKVVTPSWLENYKSSVIHFFQRNENSYPFFHPHQFSYIGILQEIIKKDKDYFVFFMDIDTIAFEIKNNGIFFMEANKKYFNVEDFVREVMIYKLSGLIGKDNG